MQIKILFFSLQREQLGMNHVQMDVPNAIALTQLKQILEKQFPLLKGMVGRWAVNQKFVPNDTVLVGDEEIAWIPPVSGG